jgi:hypothetical protein
MPEATDQCYVLPAGAFFELRDGKVARIPIHYNVKDWITSVIGEAKQVTPSPAESRLRQLGRRCCRWLLDEHIRSHDGMTNQPKHDSDACRVPSDEHLVSFGLMVIQT